MGATPRKFFCYENKEDGGEEVFQQDGDHRWWSDIGEGEVGLGTPIFDGIIHGQLTLVPGQRILFVQNSQLNLNT